MSAGYHNPNSNPNMHLGRIPIPPGSSNIQHKKTNLSQILNPTAQAQVPYHQHHQQPQQHQYQPYGYGSSPNFNAQQWRNNDRFHDNSYYGGQYSGAGDHSASQAHGHQVDVADALPQLNHNHQSLNPDPMYESDQQQQQRLRQLQRTERASTRIQAANTTQSSSGFYNSQQQPQPPDSSTLRKRNTPPEPINPPQPPKKAKKATATTGATAPVVPSKRGFSKKKRDEAAAVHATNAYVPTVTYANSELDKDNSEDRMRMLQVHESSNPLAQLHAELQSARCMSTKYKHDIFPRCNSCIRRWAGDVCRFQSLRIFMKNEKKEIVGMSFVNHQRAEKGVMEFPKKWNGEQTEENILWTMRVTARHLLPILQEERKHVDTQEIIHRPRELDCRATCDTCMTSLFCSSWMCRLCGREACGDCYAELHALTSDPIADLCNSTSSGANVNSTSHSNSSSSSNFTPADLQAEIASRIAAQQSRKEKQIHSNPTFLYCTKRSEHRAAEFTPVSRFCLRELEEAIKGMEVVLKEEEEEKEMGSEMRGREGGRQREDGHRSGLRDRSRSREIQNAEMNSSSSTASESTGVRTPPDLGSGLGGTVALASHDKDMGTGSSTNGYRYPELQPQSYQMYSIGSNSNNAYSHRAQHQQQPTYTPHSQSHPNSSYQSQSQQSQQQYPHPHPQGSYSYDPYSHSSSSSMQSQLQQQSAYSHLYSDPQTSRSTSSIPIPTPSQTLYQPPSHCPDIPLHSIPTYTCASLTQSIFQRLWTAGTPILITHVGERFKIRWTPEYFVKTYGTQSCLIVECQTDANRQVTVGEFFNEFGRYGERGLGSSSTTSVSGDAGVDLSITTTTGANADENFMISNDEPHSDGRSSLCKKGEIWKLKDWPPSADFKTTFPELYQDFSQAVPIPNYVRRDGTLNIASHFPLNGLAPDLGPKMYNAMASSPSAGSKGSTRLHMDMADALNVMTYASPCPDGSPGCAAWDLFRAEDSAKIRTFLKAKFPGSIPTDPIHGQQVYLDEVMRKELADEQGVFSYRVYQRPGEAVFIPAGCAHQVCNLADCIKVAIDFVSPENVERCKQLTKEFREQNQSKAWKEDVLGLKNMMWFAWLSCCEWREERKSSTEPPTIHTVS